MAQWHDDYPALRVIKKIISAEDYNRIRIGLSREELPWRLNTPKIRCWQFVLNESAWVCIDECQDDLPILAWTDFEVARRESLEAPISCKLHLYHMHAGLVMGLALETLVETVETHYKNRNFPHFPVSELTRKE